MQTIIDKRDLAIGVFDSGMGGLTVLKSLREHMPDESYVYLGDTARLPYGTKSPQTVAAYAMQMTKILQTKAVKCIVIACNTATTAALPYLQEIFPEIPIVGVVEPSAKAAIANTRNAKITVLATETTIRSGIYQNTIAKLAPEIHVETQSCGLFVALAEEGCVDDDIAYAVVKKYLQPLQQALEGPGCVILGCTHFPVLIEPLRQLLGDKICIVDSAEATAKRVKQILTQQQLLSAPNQASSAQFLVSDSPERFARLGQLFFGEAIAEKSIQLIDAQNSHFEGSRV